MLRDGKTPYETPVDNVTAQYNWARDFVLHNDYDGMLTVEADVIVPPDALKRLVACDADISYGLYCFRRGKMEWNAFTVVGEETGCSVSETPEYARDAWGKVIDVVGLGLGCTLISHKALRVLGRFEPWRMEDWDWDCDWTMARKAQEHGLVQRADLGLVCGHITQRPSLRILRPDPTVPSLFTIEFLDDEWFEVTEDGKLEIIVDGIHTTHVTKQQYIDALASEKYRIAMSKE